MSLPPDLPNDANGYDAAAPAFIAARSATGSAVVREWARTLPRGGAVLDLGCGHGFPVTQTLLEEELTVCGVDASSALLAELRARFPEVKTACVPVEASDFFDRNFDGIIAWGLLFLLAPDAQKLVVGKIARALQPGGQFIFTAPSPACAWRDVLTGRVSVSLGAEVYRELLRAEGLTLVAEGKDEGDNHYFQATKPA